MRPEEAAGVADVDLSGSRVLVTGSTRGIGRETVLALGRMGAEVVVHGRDAEQGAEVVEAVRGGGGSAHLLVADFEEPSEVLRLVEGVRDLGGLDVLVNNAGAYFTEYRSAWGGVEATFAVNHLAPFLLTQELVPLLERSGGRVVDVSSEAHRGSELVLDDVTRRDGYSGWAAYRRSKLANILFTAELVRRLDGATANVLHPGFVPGSALYREVSLPVRLFMAVAKRLPVGPVSSVRQGAVTPLYLAASPEVEGVTGRYFVDCGEREPSAEARDREAQRGLWEWSESAVERVTG